MRSRCGVGGVDVGFLRTKCARAIHKGTITTPLTRAPRRSHMHEDDDDDDVLDGRLLYLGTWAAQKTAHDRTGCCTASGVGTKTR